MDGNARVCTTQTMRNRPVAVAPAATLASSVSALHGGIDDGADAAAHAGDAATVMRSPPHAPSHLSHRGGGGTKTTTATGCSNSGKSHRVYCDLIIPLASDASYALLPKTTMFVFTEEHILSSTLSRISKKCPQLCSSRRKFLDTVDTIVFGAGAGGAAAAGGEDGCVKYFGEHDQNGDDDDMLVDADAGACDDGSR